MNPIDIAILSVSAIFFVRGLFRGFVYELVTVVGLILGYIISITYLSLLSAFILTYFPSLPTSVVNIGSFFVLFVGTNLILRLIANILTKTLKIAMLGWLNRVLGGILGLLKCIIILSIIVFVLDMLPFSEGLLQQDEVQSSILYPVLEMIGPRLYQEITRLTSFLFL
jgi:membrane protein required for colicin V production